MNSLSTVTICGLALFATIEIASHASAQAPAGKPAPLIVGGWKLNTEKSNVAPFAQGQFDLREYRLREDGYLIGLLMTSNARGYHYLQFTAKSDGKDYPEYTDDILADMIAAGKQTRRTYSEKTVDEYTTEWMDKADGRITGQGLKTISKDGKTMTITTMGSPRTLIYDRQ